MSRTIGLIYFEAPAYAQIEAQHGKAGAHQAMSCLASELRRSLRNTDHVSLLDDNSVLVCICLLANLSDLENIARRLRSVVERLGLGAELGAVLPIGLSIYPLNGYTGADLISAVREDFRRAAGTAECLAAPAHLELRAHCVGAAGTGTVTVTVHFCSSTAFAAASEQSLSASLLTSASLHAAASCDFPAGSPSPMR